MTATPDVTVPVPDVDQPPTPATDVQPPAAKSPVNAHEPFAGNPEYAWKALLLVVDWIKQAEIKGAASLAAAGVLGGILYNLLKSQSQPSVLMAVLAVLATGLVGATAVFGAAVFWPRLRHRDEPKSPLFFHHIARKYDGPATYVTELSLLTGRPKDLAAEIAEQVYWNSTVAHRKYTWASRAVRTLVLACVVIGLIVCVLGLRSVL